MSMIGGLCVRVRVHVLVCLAEEGGGLKSIGPLWAISVRTIIFLFSDLQILGSASEIDEAQSKVEQFLEEPAISSSA